MTNAADSTFRYRINTENQITFVNREWLAFAKENQAPELIPEHVLGQNLDRFIAGRETKQLYAMIYERVRQTGREVQIPFRCDSPNHRRYFRMCITPLLEGGLEFTVKVIRIEQRPAGLLLDNSVEHSSTFLVICSWCKRIRIDHGDWVNIEQATEKRELFGAVPPSLTHDVCPDCLATIRRQLADDA